jgi:flagellar M-ring protein FliF
MKRRQGAISRQIKALVSAASAPIRSAAIRSQVIRRKFEPVAIRTACPSKTPWFAMVVRYGVALLAVLLVLLLGVRPLVPRC